MIHVDCDVCKSSLLITLIKNNAGVVTNVGVLTDLHKEDFARFKSMLAITVDDIIHFNDNGDKKNDNFETKK